jgi:hypothetical protein
MSTKMSIKAHFLIKTPKISVKQKVIKLMFNLVYFFSFYLFCKYLTCYYRGLLHKANVNFENSLNSFLEIGELKFKKKIAKIKPWFFIQILFLRKVLLWSNKIDLISYIAA